MLPANFSYMTPISAIITSSDSLLFWMLYCMENASEVIYSPRRNPPGVAFTKDSTRDWMPVKVIGDDPDSDEEDEYDMNYLDQCETVIIF